MRNCLILLLLAVHSNSIATILEVESSGVYRVPEARVGSDSSVFNFGQPAPLIQDTATGESLFIGRQLHGSATWYHPYETRNVYWVGESPDVAADYKGRPADALETRLPGISRALHLEQNELLIRLSKRNAGDQEEPEAWFWAKLNHVASKPFEVPFELNDFTGEGAIVEVALRGISTPHARLKGELADHQLQVQINGQPGPTLEWNGNGAMTLELEGALQLLKPGDNVISFKVPRRRQTDGKHLIDVAMVDWLRVAYTAGGHIDTDQAEVLVSTGVEKVELKADAPLRVFIEPGRELEVAGDAESGFTVDIAGKGLDRLFVVRDNAFFDPWLRRPAGAYSELLDRRQQLDYLIISHPSLMSAVAPLAEFHRRRGMSVLIADIYDVYDAYGGGVTHHQAIKDFIADAYHNGPARRPQYVLLVGDSSWDRRGEGADDSRYANWANMHVTLVRPDNFMYKKGGALYPTPEGIEHRDLLPTWQYPSMEGHSASDNWYVSVDGDDHLPDLAIGRFPVVDPADVTAIVEKTMAYVTDSEVGPWRRNVLWITNEQTNFQRRSDQLAEDIASDGYASGRVYPSHQEADNKAHQETLQQAFNEGQALVHFLGHGGRFIWRTGPPDIRKNHDLFTLDHIEGLDESKRLPVVLSMTCFSAPFDHPTHDSIGEKFLRVPNRGAVAILGASWRNSPSAAFSKAIVDEILKPKVTIGEAIRRAKVEVRSEILVETYNLLGDPAIEMVKPSGAIALSSSDQSLSGEMEHTSFSGRGTADWVGEGGEVVYSTEFDVSGPRFSIAAPDLPATLVRVYVWDAERNLDAVGSLEMEPELMPASASEQPVASD